jgi:hypothetical protein
MAVTSSAPIDIGDLVTEFGGSTPHSLTEYYRGGSLVPNTTANNSVPTSGAISLTDFFGATASGGTSDALTLTVGTILIFRGFSALAGSLSPNTVEFDSWNVQIISLYHNISDGKLYLIINQNSGNSGWTSMQIGSTTYNRTDATYSVPGAVSNWVWSDGSAIPSSGTVSVTFTE